MRKFIIFILVIVLCSVGVFAWIQTTRGGVLRITLTTATETAVENPLYLALAKNSTFATDLSYYDGTVGACHSTDGVNFTDKNGNASTAYKEYTFYAKTPKAYDGLAVTGIDTDCTNAALRVAIEYYGTTTVFDPQNFSEKYYRIQMTSDATEIKVRIWFEGEKYTTPATDSFHIAIHLEGK